MSLGDILSHEACGESRRSAAYDLIGDPPYQVPIQPNPYLNHPTLANPSKLQVEGSISGAL